MASTITKDSNQNVLENKTEKMSVPDVLSSPEKILMQPYNHILQNEGKKIRTKLIQAFNFWLNIPENDVKLLQKSIEYLHNASLLMDDIEDYSTLRRGLPAAHIIYGIPMTVCSANYILAKTVLELIDQVPDEKQYDGLMIILDQLIFLHQGQGTEIYWRDSNICPTLDQYLDMIEKKTTGLFGLSVRIMQLRSTNKQDLFPLVKLIGQYFQIRDDYANLKFDEYANQKSFAEDLTEGKFSFPIVHAINSYPEDQTILNILRLRTTNNTIKRFAIRHLEKLGSIEYTEKTLKNLKKQIFMLINQLPNNPFLAEIFNLLYLEEIEPPRNVPSLPKAKDVSLEKEEEPNDKNVFDNIQSDTKDKPFYFLFPTIS